MKARQQNRIRTLISALLILAMLGSGVYAAVGSVANVNNEISVGAVNITLDHFYKKDGAEIRGVYVDEDITSGATISSVPRIKNLGISSYVRLAVNYYDESGAAAEAAVASDLAADWTKIGNYYYLTREATPGETLDVFKGILVPASWDDDNNQITMVLRADAIQAAHFTPDFTNDAPWGAVTIAEFADDEYQTDSESHTSAVTVNYDGVAEQYVDVPDGFLAQLNMLTPGDEVSGEIAISNKSDDEHGLWVDVDVTDAALGNALTVRIEKDGAVLYEGPLADLAETSLGKLAPGDAGAVSVRLSLPAETGNNVGSIQGVINWKFRVDAEEQPIPVGPQTEDNITTAMIIFLASFGGLVLLSIFEKRERDEEK